MVRSRRAQASRESVGRREVVRSVPYPQVARGVMSVQVPRRLFTTTEYYQMARAGILAEDEQVELLQGEILEMTPIGSRHAACVDRLNRLFNVRLGQRAIVRVQSPIHLSEYSEPEPDLVLLEPRADFYVQAHPEPEDVLLLVEVAETSVEYDRQVKVPLYVQSGILEVWLIDVLGACVEVYRNPGPQGYGEVRRHGPDQSLVPHAFLDLNVAVNEILG